MDTPKIFASFNRRKTATEITTAKVEIEIYFSRNERKRITTGIELLVNQWDGDFVVRHPQSRQLNKKIGELINQYRDIVREMRYAGEDLTLDNFNAALRRQTCDTNFIDFCKTEIDNRGLRGSTYRAHVTAIEALERFGGIMEFEDLTPENVARFDTFLRKEDPTRTQVTLHNYHKRLKPYVNEAVRRGLIKESPYTRFADKRGRHKERQPLTMSEIKMIRELAIEDKRLAKVRDLFIFCCYTGLSWVDLEAFDWTKHVVECGGHYYIDGRRIKTGTAYYTPILPPAMEVLERYGYRLSTCSNQAANRNLKVIAGILGLRKPLTCHIARHTFATSVVLAHDVPIEALSKMLGHTKIAVTQIYAKVLNSSVERQAEKLYGILD